MTTPIDFYFDFSSPYGYLAATRIEDLAAKHGRTVNWHPILLGAVFKVTGGAPLPSLPLKGDYARIDILRCARLFGVPYTFPAQFPIPTQVAARMTLWARASDPARAKALALALYRAYFAEGKDITQAQVCADVAAGCGFDRAAATASVNDDAIKNALKAEVDAAIERKVFGSPYFIVDGEPFWGADRLDHLERWLATGGW